MTQVRMIWGFSSMMMKSRISGIELPNYRFRSISRLLTLLLIRLQQLKIIAMNFNFPLALLKQTAILKTILMKYRVSRRFDYYFPFTRDSKRRARINWREKVSNRVYSRVDKKSCSFIQKQFLRFLHQPHLEDSGCSP